MTASVYKGLFRGAAWTMTTRWSMRFIGFINIMILARLLEPADFGILAMATAVIGFAQSFTELGAQQLLIRTRDVERDDINAAWTIKLLQGLVVGVLVFLTAEPAASYFNDERIEPVIRLLALTPVIAGFTNIGLVLARKDLDFALDFRASVYSRVGSFVVTLTLVLVMRNYWALIYGTLLGEAIAVLISYWIHPYRPRMCFRRMRPYLRFASSIIPSRIARYGNTKAGLVVAGGVASTGQLGIYNMALDLTKLLTSELTVPLASGLFPGYSKINHNQQQLTMVFANVFAATVTILMPLGIGLGLVAVDFIPLLLGPNWLDAVPYVHWLCVALVVSGVNQLLTNEIMIVSGFERRVAVLLWFRLLTYVPCMFFAGHMGGIFAIVQAEAVYTLCYFPVCTYVLTRSVPITVGQILAKLWRPLLSTIAMVCAVLTLNSFIAMTGVSSLLAKVLVGGLAYVITLYATWAVAGYPQGIERLFRDQLLGRYRAYRSISSPRQ